MQRWSAVERKSWDERSIRFVVMLPVEERDWMFGEILILWDMARVRFIDNRKGWIFVMLLASLSLPGVEVEVEFGIEKGVPIRTRKKPEE